MANESPTRPGQGSDAEDGAPRSTGESAPLQARAAFLQNWRWESVVSLNQGLCSRDKAQHGPSSETHAACQKEWQLGCQTERSLIDTFDWLRSFHRKAPFLFFNGNTFAEIARTLSDAFFAEFPPLRRRVAASLSAHYVAGVLERDELTSSLQSLTELADFKPGERVRTLRGSRHGVIRRLLPDGRVAWRPDGSRLELIALPESLLPPRK